MARTMTFRVGDVKVEARIMGGTSLVHAIMNVNESRHGEPYRPFDLTEFYRNYYTMSAYSLAEIIRLADYLNFGTVFPLAEPTIGTAKAFA